MLPTESNSNQTIFIVDDDKDIREFLITFFEMNNFKTKGFSSAKDYIDQLDSTPGCLVSDILMPGMDGIELLTHLNKIEHLRPTIFITGNANIPTSVESIKLGAVDFIEKPFKAEVLLAKVQEAIESFEKNLDAISHYKNLTQKEQQVFACMIKGSKNKIIAEKLGITTSTTEKHRAAVMNKMRAESLVALANIVPLLNPLSIDFETES